MRKKKKRRFHGGEIVQIVLILMEIAISEELKVIGILAFLMHSTSRSSANFLALISRADS